MPLTLLFCHGWGFDGSFWEPLAGLLSDFAQRRDDAGYFGDAAAPSSNGRVLAVTHSLGTMRLLAKPPADLVGLVAIAGFDRFSAGDGFPGTPKRVVDRMVSAVAQEPETVLSDFHALFGSDVPSGTPDIERLQADLIVLRDGDRRAEAERLSVPILSLQAERDTLLPVAMRETVFAAARGVMRRTHPGAGHLLADEDPAWCAQAIRDFIAALP